MKHKETSDKKKVSAKTKIAPKDKKPAKTNVKSVIKTPVFPKSPKGNFLSRLHSIGIDQRVLEAFEHVDQEIFFDKMFKDQLYGEGNIPIGEGERSDHFDSLARMINYLAPSENNRILEVGSGSGYSTAVLSLLCREVVSVEINEKLAGLAKKRLYGNNFGNIRFFAGDGTEPDEAYGAIDGVIIHAACRKRPLAMLVNLKESGKIVFPMGPAHTQQIAILINKANIERGEHFTTTFSDTGVFSLIEGAFGYNEPVIPIEEFMGGEEPPKSLDSTERLFVPPKES